MCDARIPPRSEVNITTMFQNCGGREEASSDWATEPMELKEGLLVGRAVLPRRSDDLPVRVLNTSTKEVVFRAWKRSRRSSTCDRGEKFEHEKTGQ